MLGLCALGAGLVAAAGFLEVSLQKRPRPFRLRVQLEALVHILAGIGMCAVLIGGFLFLLR